MRNIPARETHEECDLISDVGSAHNNTKQQFNGSEERKQQFTRDQEAMLSGKYPLHTRFTKNYRLRCLLGQGSFGFVFLAEHLGNKTSVAVKFILKERIADWHLDGLLGTVPKEVAILSSICGCTSRDCRVIRLLDYIDDAANPRYVYMITEYWGIPWNSISAAKLLQTRRLLGWRGGHKLESSPGDLFECIEAHAFLPLPTIRLLFAQMSSTVCHLSTVHQIVHRDLKDENVVVDGDYQIRLIDFGSAGWRAGASSGGQFHGTMAFAAPEIILRRGPAASSYDQVQAEVWSLGILLYTMAMRRAPFADPWSILHADPLLPMDDGDDGVEGRAGMYDLIRKLLQKDPDRRIRMEAIQSHPWLAPMQRG